MPDEQLPPEHPKAVLHNALQAALKNPEVAPGMQDAVLTRWVIVGELILPEARRGLATISSGAGQDDLVTWDRLGLLTGAIARIVRGEGR